MTGNETIIRNAWGKLHQRPGGSLQHLGLVSHCADVAAVAGALLDLPVWRSRFNRLAGRVLGDEDIERLLVFVFLHDVGKSSVGFWLKQFDHLNSDETRKTTERRRLLRTVGGDLSECGHTTEVSLLLREEFRPQFTNALPIEDMGRWSPDLMHWSASISHHGTPVILDQPTSARGAWTWRPLKDLSYDPFDGLRDLGDRAKLWFPMAFNSDSSGLPRAAPFIHAFAGLVSLADWIGSNREQGFFPYDLAIPDDRWNAARDRAELVLRKMRLNTTEAASELRGRNVQFGQVFTGDLGAPFKPTPLQRAMTRHSMGGLLIAEDETGAGKTEAALWRFKTLFEAGEVDSLAFVLPTRVAAMSLAKRVDIFIERLFPDVKLRPNTVLAVPGYLVSDGLEGKRLARFEVLWTDNEQDASAYRHWAAENSKRYLAAAVAVGTIDQVLLSALQVRHAHLRGISLLRSLLVVDEVHASDVYMTEILCTLLERQLRAGGHALLLSATLGGESRQRFQRLGLSNREQRNLAASCPHVEAPYPCLSTTTEIIALSEPDGKAQKEVAVNLKPMMQDPEAIAGQIADAISQDARVLVVRNTVAGAIEVQYAVENYLGEDHPALFRCRDVACMHHGRYAALDRKLLDQEVEKQFGKNAPGGARTLVGTQTLEQSLDIDADILITDLCPMDVLLQRIGRLHRHRRDRPAAYQGATAIILTPPDRDLSRMFRTRGVERHGLGSVYENLMSVEATWRALERRSVVSIPADNRRLVEECTDGSMLYSLAESLGVEWLVTWGRLTGKQIGERGEANVRELDWREPFAKWSDNRHITTRLGEPSHLLRLNPPQQSPFGQTLTELQIPDWMWPKDCDAEVAENLIGERGEIGFEVGGARFGYDRFGVRGERR